MIEPIKPVDSPHVVLSRCRCGWTDYFPTLRESPETCPKCGADLVIRNLSEIGGALFHVKVTANKVSS